MIVTYTKKNRHIIPRTNGIDQVMLVPGSQELPNQEWFEARCYVGDMIDAGIIIEEWTKRGPDDKECDKRYMIVDPDEPKQVKYPAILRDKNKTEARRIIEDCTHLRTLQKWNQEEIRAELSVAILNQLKKTDLNTSRDYAQMEQQVLEGYNAKR